MLPPRAGTGRRGGGLRRRGERPQAYAVYLDDEDAVWLSDFGGNAVHRFDPATERFASCPLPSVNASIRQILGRPGKVWLPFSGSDEIGLTR